MSSPRTIDQLQTIVANFNAGSPVALYAALSPNFYAHTPRADEPKQNETFRKFIEDIRTAFSDLQLSLTDLAADGKQVRGSLTLAGTNDGRFWDAPATNAALEFSCEVALRHDETGWMVSLENVGMPQLIGIFRALDIIPPPEDMDKPPKYPITIPEMMMRIMFTGQVADKPCSHMDMIKVIEPAGNVCDDCAPGEIYPTVRLCLTCGHLGCCDTSKHKHAHKHYQETGHPLIRSIRLDEGWIWCYKDNAFFSKKMLEKYR